MIRLSFLDVGAIAPTSFKYMPWVAGIIAGAGQTSSGIANYVANRETNASNREIARETNEMNYKIHQEDNEFNSREAQIAREWDAAQNLAQWNRENEYNTPAAQKQRLLAAGINPAAVFGNGSISEAGSFNTSSSPASAGSPPAMQAPTMQAANFDWIGNGIHAATSAYFEAQRQNDNHQRNQYDNQIAQVSAQFAAAKNLADLNESYARIQKMLDDRSLSQATREKLEAESDDLRVRLDFFKETWSDMVNSIRKDNNLKDASYNSIMADVALKNSQKAILDFQLAFDKATAGLNILEKSARIKNILQDTALKCAQGQLTSALEVQQHLQNGLASFEFWNGLFKHEGKSDARPLITLLDIVGETIFKNIKLMK